MANFSVWVLGCALITASASAEGAPRQAQTAPPAQAATPAGSVGLYVYPKNQQSASQQSKDESACYQTAKTQSGVDPVAPPPPPDEAAKAKGGGAKGAAGGAAGGAAIGAIAGDAGTGAAIGATAGAVKGRRQQKKANKQAEQQAAAGAKAQNQAVLDSFKRSMSACLDARGYSVK